MKNFNASLAMRRGGSLINAVLACLLVTSGYAQDNNVKDGPGSGSNINNSGAANVMIGNYAGYNTTSGIVNVMIGNHAGVNTTTGNYNTFIGNAAGGGNINGSNNTYIGDGSGYNSTGSFNMMLGVHAGFFNTSGSNNVMIGPEAGNAVTTGNLNTIIGANANVSNGAGAISNATAIGAYALATASNTVILGNNANVGIGTSTPQYKLSVNGTVAAKEVKVTANGWADFVFKPSYRLPRLDQVENYILRHQHLPDIPSQKEVVAQGLSLGQMQAKLLQKIEELTLYVIQQQKEIGQLKKRINHLSSRNARR